jgi:CrcB protein
MLSWSAIILIFLGGGIGSVLRLLVSVGMRYVMPSLFPWSTLLVNIIGSFVIGWGTSMLYSTSSMEAGTHTNFPDWFAPLLLVGICGGFTTFSTFSFEALTLLQQNQFTLSALYIVISLVLGLCAVGLGVWLGQ